MTDVRAPSEAELEPRLPFLRWTGLLVLLLAEGLSLSISYDSDALDDLPDSVATFLLRRAGSILRIGSVVIACFFLVTAARGPRAASPTLRRALAAHRYVVVLGVHLVVFGTLAALTTVLFGAELPAHAGLLASAWLLALVAALVTWTFTIIPARALRLVAGEQGPWLGLSLAVGSIAFGVGKLSDHLWLPLRRVTFSTSSFLLGLFIRDHVSDPALFAFGTPSFIVDIAPQCSGYEGIGLISVFLLAALWLFRDRLRFPIALWLIPIGIVTSFAANTVRLVALVLVGTYVSPEIGAGGFHSYAGTLLFCGLGLVIVAVALRSPRFSKTAVGLPAASTLAPGPNPASPYLVPFLATIAAGLIARAFSSADGEPLYVVRPLVALVVLAVYAPVYRAPAWRETWRVSWFAPLVGLLVAAIWVGLAVARSGAGAGDGDASSAFDFAARTFMTVMVVPVTEELAFRGFLARRASLNAWSTGASTAFDALAPRAITTAGVAVSSIAFGLLHARPLAGLAAGVAYALVYRARGRLADAVVAHAVTNAALVVATLATGAAWFAP